MPLTRRSREKGGKFEITPSKEGLTVDMDATKAALNDALNSEDTDAIRVEASVTVDKPKVTEEDLATIKDVLGTFSTSFATSGASRSTNLAVGSGKINGHVLMPGEVLSGMSVCTRFHWKMDIRRRLLMRMAGLSTVLAAVSARSLQLSTTRLYTRSWRSFSQNHSMSVSYVKPSMDAAIAGTYKDLKVKNPYDTPDLYRGIHTGKDTDLFTIYGKETHVRRIGHWHLNRDDFHYTVPDPGDSGSEPPGRKNAKVESDIRD